MNKSIVIVNQSSGFLVVDDLNAYCTQYDKVTIICGILQTGCRKLNQKVVVDHIVKYDRTSSFKRILTWSIGSFQIFIKILFKYRDYEVVYYSNPPMACFSALFLKNRFRIVEYDIYPDALHVIGISSSNPIYKIWVFLKKMIYKKAEMIFTLSEGMRTLLSRYGDDTRIKVVPLWPASEDFRMIEKLDNPFVIENHIQDKFIVLYSGNIGYTHSVEILIDIAKAMQYDNEVLFLIIGEGKKKQSLQNEVQKQGLQNVVFMPFQSFETLPYSLAAADLGVVTLDNNVANASVPSKTFNLMASGVPLLAIASKDTELSCLISKYDNGVCIAKDNTEAMIKYIVELKDNKEKLQKLRKNSFEASKNFTYRNANLYLI